MDADELYKKYSENYMGNKSNKKLKNYHKYRISSFVDLFRRNFEGDLRVIDYGCGDGVLKKALSVENYIGIDPSEEMIRLSHQLNPDSIFQFSRGGLDELNSAIASPPGSSPVDSVLVCLNTLPYMSKEEVDKFFQIGKANRLPIIVSHTNELLDLVSYNRYTIEHRKDLMPDGDLEIYLAQFKMMLSNPEQPPKVSQVEARFGRQPVNTSERDSIKKFRVDPFSWPGFIAKKYDYIVREIQPIRIFAFPPAIMERDEVAMAILHSDRFDGLPDTYKNIFCSQFRVVFTPSQTFS